MMITDVTTRSFSVIWNVSESAVPEINVFDDPEGFTPTDNTTISLFPVNNGDTSVQSAARAAGVMKVEVKGLAPGKTYYFNTKTTSISTNHITLHPETTPLLSVTTELKISRSEISGADEFPFANDLVIMDCYLPDNTSHAEGALLVAGVEGGSYPVSGFVGDGMASPFAYVDLNNLFSGITHETLPLYGGESLILTTYLGMYGKQTVSYAMPGNNQLAEMRPPEKKTCGGDFDGDGDADGDDLVILTSELGACLSGCLCDSEPDGDVDNDDLEQFALRFGSVDCQ